MGADRSPDPDETAAVDLQAMSLSPTDVLVINFRRCMPPSEQRGLLERIREAGIGNRIIMADEGCRVSLHHPETPCPADASPESGASPDGSKSASSCASPGSCARCLPPELMALPQMHLELMDLLRILVDQNAQLLGMLGSVAEDADAPPRTYLDGTPIHG